jgi:hypothetical protein
VPDKSTADAAIRTAQELLTEFSPLPGPRDVLKIREPPLGSH